MPNKELTADLSQQQSALENLIYRMNRPQRHRLLHGYPMSSGMTSITENVQNLAQNIQLDPEKKLAVCIIPHPYCNPKVKGCGYCTFPNEAFSRAAEVRATGQVAQEIRLWKTLLGPAVNRPVQSMYIGGGTANLMSKESWKTLVEAIRDTLQFIPTGNGQLPTEITYEGAPAYFTESRLRQYAKDFPECRKRVSFGIESFSVKQLQLMGRSPFNNQLERTMEICRELDISTSADLLFNLPGQSWADIKEDIEKAICINLDQICWYNLVCYPGLGTKWSEDPEIMSTIPNIEEGLQNWLALCDFLHNKGYIETSVTNFRRKDNPRGRFLYEENVREAWNFDGLSAGVTAISMLSNWNLKQAVKIQNPPTSITYNQRWGSDKLPWNTKFIYELYDLKILYLTRVLKGNYISFDHYQKIFACSLLEDFSYELDACVKADLLIPKANDFILTAKGAYYLDSIAGLIAEKRVKYLRNASG